MPLPEIWEKLISNVQQTGWKEWVSTVTQIASVWYARKNNVLVYPTGIIGVLLAAWLYFFAEVKIFGWALFVGPELPLIVAHN